MSADRRLDLKLLEVLVVLSDCGSASKAAAQLGISQPSVSAALSRLRAHFNDPLFLRTATGMTPTSRGSEVVSTVRDILHQVDSRLGSEQPFEPANRGRPFTFALSDVGEIVFLPRIVRELARCAPGTSIRSVSMRPTALAEALEQGEVDLAVGYFPDLQGAGFFQQLLFTHHFVCLLRNDHPLQGNRLTMSEYLSLEHAVVHSEGRSQEILEAFLQLRGFNRRVALYTPHFLSIPKLIAQSDMVVAVPHAVGIAYGTELHRLKVIDLPFESPRIELRQHWHRRQHKDSRSIWLRRVISELFNAETDEWGRKAGTAP